MNDDELIDLLLKKIVERDPEVITISDFISSDNEADYYAYNRISGKMKESNLAEVLDSNRIQANETSRKIVKMGGYHKYIAIQEKLKQKNEKRQELEFRNLELQVKINEFFLKTKFWPFFIAILSLVLSLIAVLK